MQPANAALLGGIGQGARVLSPGGEVRIEALRAGESVLTLDRGPQDVRWVGRLAPMHAEVVRVERQALEPGMPCRDLEVSPDQALLLTGVDVTQSFGEDGVLVAARHLTDVPGVSVARAGAVYGLMLDAPEILLVDGAPLISLRPAESLEDLARDPRLSGFLSGAHPRQEPGLHQLAPLLGARQEAGRMRQSLRPRADPSARRGGRLH